MPGGFQSKKKDDFTMKLENLRYKYQDDNYIYINQYHDSQQILLILNPTKIRKRPPHFVECLVVFNQQI